MEQIKKYLSWEDFEVYLWNLQTIINKEKPDGVITLYRGGLTIGTAVSNRHNLDLSIINYQTRHATTESEPVIILDKGICNYETILLVDEIKDSGKSLSEVIKMLNTLYPDLKIITNVWIDASTNENAIGKWFIFPWEESVIMEEQQYCYCCDNGEECNKNQIDVHCNIHNKSYDSFHFCPNFK